MKTKILAVCILVAFTSGVAAQGVYGRVNYVTTSSDATLTDPGDRQENKSILEFDNGRSLYRNFPKETSQGGDSVMDQDLGTEHFLDTDKDESVARLSFSEDAMIIKGKLRSFQWVITDEFKKIAGYRCNKATSTAKEKSNGDKQDVIIAWFAPEIQTKVGPESYWGLPGLILELETGKKKISCTGVKLNPSVKPAIVAPSDGIVMTAEEVLEMAPARPDEIKNINEEQPQGVIINVISE